MGDEASKKDLQALQVAVNKKIADLDSKVNKAMLEDNNAYTKVIDQINKSMADMSKVINENGSSIIAHEKFHAEVRTVVAQHSQAINALQK